jgi:predicted alpha/beta-fold hydrolase
MVLFLKTVMHSNQNYNPISPQFEEVKFSSGKLILHGFIHKPKGNGSFPAILMNHGSEQFPKSGQRIVDPYVNQGYVVFFPHRRGQGYSSSQSEYIMDSINREPATTRDKKFVELQETHIEIRSPHYLISNNFPTLMQTELSWRVPLSVGFKPYSQRRNS